MLTTIAHLKQQKWWR